MYIYYIYVIISAASVLFINNFAPILRENHSWWLVPLMFAGIFIGLVLLQLIIFGLMIVTANLKGKAGKGGRFFRFLLKNSLPIIVKLARAKIVHNDLDKIPDDTRLLLVCNHQHNFDPVIIYYLFPDLDLAFIGKKEIYTTMPLVARAMHRLNSLPIDRENDREAAKTILKAIKMIKDDEASIGLFPEGYCSVDDELLPLRNGSLKIAMKSGAPIVVCVINNTKKLAKNLFRHKTRVDFHLLDVIAPEQYAGMNTTELGDIIHGKMKTALDEIKGR